MINSRTSWNGRLTFVEEGQWVILKMWERETNTKEYIASSTFWLATVKARESFFFSKKNAF